jgi:hypothetical protein
MRRALAVMVSCACGRIGFGFEPPGSDGTLAERCAGPFAWNPPQRLAELVLAYDAFHPSISADNQLLAIQDGCCWRLAISSWLGAAWSPPADVGEVAVAGCSTQNGAWNAATTNLYLNESCQSLPAPGVNLYVASYRAGVFTAPQPIAGLEAVDGMSPVVSVDELELFYTIIPPSVPGASRIGRAHRATTLDAWTDDGVIPELVAGSATGFPRLSRDGRTILMEVTESSTLTKLYTATRSTSGSPFGPLSPITELNDPTANDGDPDLSWDCESMYFSSDRAGEGKAEVYVATRAN